MKLLVALCLVAVVATAPPPNYQSGYNDKLDARLENFFYKWLGPGAYRFGFSQTDGQRVEQTGKLKNEGQENEALSVSGSYSWVAPNNVNYTVKYTADEDGYQPEIEEGPGFPAAYVAAALG